MFVLPGVTWCVVPGVTVRVVPGVTICLVPGSSTWLTICKVTNVTMCAVSGITGSVVPGVTKLSHYYVCNICVTRSVVSGITASRSVIELCVANWCSCNYNT